VKRIRYGILLLLAAVTIIQACSKGKMDENAPVGIPLSKDIQSIAVLDFDGNLVAEHREPDEINELLQGMKKARRSFIGDPEQSGDLYEIVISGNGKSRTFSVNDLRTTNTLGASVKLYATLPSEKSARAWALNTDWMQLLLNPKANEEEPALFVTPDEDSDSVILVANRDIDQQSLREAIQTSLSIRADNADAIADYTLNWSDLRRVVVRFPSLPQGSQVVFTPEGVKTGDGAHFRIHPPEKGGGIVIRQGPAWSGLRWVDTAGRTVHEHGFDSAVMIESLKSGENVQEIMIYNHDRTAYWFRPGTRDIEGIQVKEWVDDREEKFSSDHGVDVLYSYPDERDVFYAARGLKTIYRIDSSDGKQLAIYESDRPIYGMASSPDGKHIALLVDSERNLGPYADLVVIDANGKTVSTYTKAAYSGHSEGWHLIYPVTWRDDETVAVPLTLGESFLRGKALYHYRQGLLSKEETAVLPEDAFALLQSEIDGLNEAEIMRVLPKSDDDQARYYAVYVPGSGSYLIDREDRKADLVGSGALVAWTSAGQVVVWHSTEGKFVDYVGMD